MIVSHARIVRPESNTLIVRVLACARVVSIVGVMPMSAPSGLIVSDEKVSQVGQVT